MADDKSKNLSDEAAKNALSKIEETYSKSFNTLFGFLKEISQELYDKIESRYKETFKNIDENIKTYTANEQKEINKMRRAFGFDKTMAKIAADSRKEASHNISSFLQAADRGGFIGKIAKVAGLAVFGLEGSSRRKKMETQVSIAAHPEAYPKIVRDEFTKLSPLIGQIFGTFTKFAPLFVLLGGIVSKFVAIFMDWQGVLANVVKSTGTAEINVQDISRSIIASTANLSLFGIETQDEVASVGALAGEFKSVNLFTQDAIDTVTILSKRLDLSANDAARLYRIMNQSWKMTNLDIRKFTTSLRVDAAKYGLNLNDIMKDIVANADHLTVYFGGSAQRLHEAAIHAAQLGTNLSTIVSMSAGFEHWADAIQNSFMASQITQTQWNAKSLYQKALFGDIAGLTDEIADNLVKGDKSWRTSPTVGEALANSLHTTTEELVRITTNKTLQNLINNKGGALKIKFEKNKLFDGNGQIDVALIGNAIGKIAAKNHTTTDNILDNLDDNIKLQGEVIGEARSQKDAASTLAKTIANSEMLKDGSTFAKSMGLGELQSPLDKISASMGFLLQQVAMIFMPHLIDLTVKIAAGVQELVVDIAKIIKFFTPSGDAKPTMFGGVGSGVPGLGVAEVFYNYISDITDKIWTGGAHAAVDVPTTVKQKGFQDMPLQQANPNTSYQFQGRQGMADYVAAGPKTMWNDLLGNRKDISNVKNIDNRKDIQLQQDNANLTNFKNKTNDYITNVPRVIRQDLLGNNNNNNKNDYTSQKQANDLDEIKKGITQLVKLFQLNKDVPLDVNVYLDGDTLAENIEKHQVRIAGR